MTGTATISIRRDHERRSDLLRDASALMQACGVVRSSSWIRRTVGAFLASSLDGMPFGVFLAARLELNTRQRKQLAEREDLRYLLSYSDPTGETAVRHVLRERGY